MLKTTDFDYHLPEELIASRPPETRDTSRMLIVDRATGSISHDHFANFPNYVKSDDLVVFNDTRVVPSRFFSNDQKIEIVRLDEPAPRTWKCLVRPGKKMRVGNTIQIDEVTGTVTEILPDGERLIQFDQDIDIQKHGHLALPHYMKRDAELGDRERYQTVYAKTEGAIAAPTAGLHFTDDLIKTLPHTFVTLHVGVGTFAPVKADLLTDHKMHSERFQVSEEAAKKINTAKRVISIGTTVTRVLEHLSATNGKITTGPGDTNIFIYPPYKFSRVDALLTNFHLPKSTLLMLISAFAGTDLIRQAYKEAVEKKYRFFSYGDCMLIL
jgi:S-adenosylmethionine:tRNA ribosyltransferase-isomerase